MYNKHHKFCNLLIFVSHVKYDSKNFELHPEKQIIIQKDIIDCEFHIMPMDSLECCFIRVDMKKGI